jgi:uncharacterized protein DUF2752
MASLASRPGFAAGVIAAVILVELAAARLALSADRGHVYLLDKTEIRAVCLFKQRFGIPCPTCGITRSVVLTLHGHTGPAWQLNPGGPIAVLSALYLSGAMLVLGFWQWTGRDNAAAAARRRIRFSTVTLGIVLVAAIVFHWTSELIAAAGR